MNRKNFLRTSLSASALLSLNPFTLVAHEQEIETGSCASTPLVDINRYIQSNVKPFGKKLKVLILGGTKFFGPPLVQYAIERGHDVTLLNRKKSNPHLFKTVKHIKADRIATIGNPYEKAIQQEWDVVIDTWQDNPLAVKEAVDMLKNKTKQYIYISSIAVYTRDNYSKPIINEGDVYAIKDAMPASKDLVMADYRSKKQLADDYVRKNIPNATVIRCHQIHGYYEEIPSPGQRYWPIRFQQGGEIICPGTGDDHFQVVHVQDAAMFAIHCAEQKHIGIFHACKRYSLLEYMLACKAMSTAKSTIHWLPLEKLNEVGIRPFSDMPGYVPKSSGPGFNNCNDDKAIAHGMKHRSLVNDLKDLIDGYRVHYTPDFEFGNKDCPAGISKEKELTALKKLNLI